MFAGGKYWTVGPRAKTHGTTGVNYHTVVPVHVLVSQQHASESPDNVCVQGALPVFIVEDSSIIQQNVHFITSLFGIEENVFELLWTPNVAGNEQGFVHTKMVAQALGCPTSLLLIRVCKKNLLEIEMQYQSRDVQLNPWTKWNGTSRYLSTIVEKFVSRSVSDTRTTTRNNGHLAKNVQLCILYILTWVSQTVNLTYPCHNITTAVMQWH